MLPISLTAPVPIYGSNPAGSLHAAYPSPTTSPSFDADCFSIRGSMAAADVACKAEDAFRINDAFTTAASDPLHMFSPYDTMTYYRDQDQDDAGGIFRNTGNAQMFQLPAFASMDAASPCSAAMAAAALGYATSATAITPPLTGSPGGSSSLSPRSFGGEDEYAAQLSHSSGSSSYHDRYTAGRDHDEEGSGFRLGLTVAGDLSTGCGIELSPANLSLEALASPANGSHHHHHYQQQQQQEQQPKQQRSYSASDSDGSTTLHVAEQRRQVHIQSEQKRRAQIKDGFEELRVELPHCVNKKISKAQILTKTSLYIRQLKNSQFSLMAEIERLRSENERLRKLQGDAALL